jgi:hypothetical protein
MTSASDAGALQQAAGTPRCTVAGPCGAILVSTVASFPHNRQPARIG